MSDVPRDDRPFTAAVLTISDRASTGETEDRSGPLLLELLGAAGFRVVATTILPDERTEIGDRLRTWADRDRVALICTTGGTGLAPRDVTPEATRDILEREAPGIAEAMRLASLPITPLAMLSRAVAGVRRQTLIVNLPGSPKAVRECFAIIAPVLRHAVELIEGAASPHQLT
ncbi:MAG: MogA/MoaB family molybdenum cofactor biosynthesis protein [Chloroflexota bacterium]